MDFTKSQIAGLVLGYLKSEKCLAAVDEFVEASRYLKDYKNKGKYFITRVSGMCLVDFLKEYANIYCIVHSRLEASNCYDEMRKSRRTTLVEQLLYLLDKEENALVNSTPISEARESDATPAYTLPGNNCSDESDTSSQKTPKRRRTRTRSTNTKSIETEDMFDVSEVLTQTFLESRELQEKIAETINIVRNTPEVSKPVMDEHISAGASKELDAIIKTVVQRTEEDPVYNKLIDEIIGTAPFDNVPMKKSVSAHNLSQHCPSCLDHDSVSKTKENAILSDKMENQSTSSEVIDDHNNDAVRSIIEVSQNPPQQSTPINFVNHEMALTATSSSASSNNEVTTKNDSVYVFDGTLDTYLKSSGGQTAVPSNPVYINTGGLIVMPQETTSKQFYIVNNQPLINMNVKGMITDTDIMTMPTIIVNDETHTTLTNQNFAVATVATTVTKNNTKRAKNTKIAPKIPPTIVELPPTTSCETTPKDKKKSKTTKGELINSIPTMSSEPSTVVVTASQTTPSVIHVPTTKVPTPRQASHVRNLDFSTPPAAKAPPTKKEGWAWDADLRSLVCPPTNKSPTPKRKRPLTVKPKGRKSKALKNKLEEKMEGEKTEEVITGEDEEEKEKPGEDIMVVVEKEEEMVGEKKEEEMVGEKKEEETSKALATPIKDILPKTPGAGGINNFHCTPFNDVLEEQLRGVDLISLPTPKIPITPGFAITPGLNLTPADLPPYNNRSTDYSTSSSYYQPSDTEQNKSVEQLIEECRKLEKENTSPPLPAPIPPEKQLKIISEVVIKESCVQTKTAEKRKCDEHLKKFNHNVIGKKNLSLLKRLSSSSSSSDSDSSDLESVKSEGLSNKTIICKESDESAKTDSFINNMKKESSISNIISEVQVKKTLDEETRKKNLLSHLEEVRKRTIAKIKNTPQMVKKTRNYTKQPPKEKTPKTPKRTETTKKRRNSRKKEKSPDEINTDEEAQKLVTGLAQRGIHLVHKKTPQKPEGPPKPEGKKEDEKLSVLQNEETKEVAPPEASEDSSTAFDCKVYENYDLILREERAGKKKNSKTYDLEVLKKGFEARVFAEHLNEEVTRTMRSTPFVTLLDLPSKAPPSPRKGKKTREEIEDELMDYVFVASSKDDSPDTKPAGKGGRKRKSRLSGETKQTEKKSKTYEHDIKLLKKIDVDMFLDKVHGE